MNRAMPTITERAAALTGLLKAETNVKRAQRLQMLYRLASKQAKPVRRSHLSLAFIAKPLGTGSRAPQQAGGKLFWSAPLPPAQPHVLPRRSKLSCAHSAPSRRAVLPLGQLLSGSGRTTASSWPMRLSPPWFAPSSRPGRTCRGVPTGKKTKAIERVTVEVVERLKPAVPRTSGTPLKMWTQDERRWGLMPSRRRRITPRGVKPVLKTPHQDATCWRSGPVAPERGERFFLLLPKRNAVTMQLFRELCAAAHPDPVNLMLMDQRGAHKATCLGIASTIGLVFVALACPALNPTERRWADVRGKLASPCCAHLDWLEDELCAHLDQSTDAIVQSLTGYLYLRQAINAVCL